MSFGDVHLVASDRDTGTVGFGRFNPREVRSRRIRGHDSLLSRTSLSHASSTFLPSGWTMVYQKDVFARLEKEAIGPNLRYLMPEGTEITLQPAAAALYKQRADSLGKGRPSSMCLPHGIPDAMLVAVFEDMQLAGYSSKTQQAYVGAVRQFFAHFNCSPAQLTEEQLRSKEYCVG